MRAHLGISETDLPHIFERFYRADQNRSRETRGSGLGLAIAKWIAEKHGAVIEAKSETLRGSLFRVRIPLATDRHYPPQAGSTQLHSVEPAVRT